MAPETYKTAICSYMELHHILQSPSSTTTVHDFCLFPTNHELVANMTHSLGEFLDTTPIRIIWSFVMELLNHRLICCGVPASRADSQWLSVTTMLHLTRWYTISPNWAAHDLGKFLNMTFIHVTQYFHNTVSYQRCILLVCLNYKWAVCGSLLSYHCYCLLTSHKFRVFYHCTWFPCMGMFHALQWHFCGSRALYDDCSRFCYSIDFITDVSCNHRHTFWILNVS